MSLAITNLNEARRLARFWETQALALKRSSSSLATLSFLPSFLSSSVHDTPCIVLNTSDPLSVAASIAGLITIADIVVRKGYHYLRDFKGVEKTAKKLIDEVNVLSGILHSLKNVAEYLESDDYQFDPATQIHYVHSCQQSLKRIQEQLDNADPTPASGVKKLKKKLKWPFEKRKTEEFLAEIEEHKATMTLAMSADEM